jgi:hypothetical protein
MKTLTTLLALALFCATGYGQTIKALGYDTASGEVVANTGTNTLTFTNAFNVATNAVAQVRTNLGLGGGDSPTFSGLTLESATLNVDSIKGVNNEATQIDLGSGDFSSPSGTFIFTTDSDKLSVGTEIEFIGDEAATNAATTRTNLGIPLPALTNDSNVTMMRALAGSTNTNAPFSGSVVADTNTLVFTNGILIEVQ